MGEPSSKRPVIGAVVLTLLCVLLAFQLGLLDFLIAHRVVQGKLGQGPLDEVLVTRMNLLSFGRQEWNNQWLGIEIRQYPNDLQLYQEVIREVQPDFIIETGTLAGGLTLYLAMVLEAVNPKGKIITVDLFSDKWDATVAKLDLPAEQKKRWFDRIQFIKGSSTAPETIQQVAKEITPGSKVLVILDSLHTKEHVLGELKLYSPLVSPNSYLIVNDTNLDGNTYNAPEDKNTPGADQAYGVQLALKEWLPTAPNFSVDPKPARFVVSCAHGGFLKRIK
jgi:cephalosporin hydroxylase